MIQYSKDQKEEQNDFLPRNVSHQESRDRSALWSQCPENFLAAVFVETL